MNRYARAAATALIGAALYTTGVAAQVAPEPDRPTPVPQSFSAAPPANQGPTSADPILPTTNPDDSRSARMAPAGGFDAILLDNEGRALYTFSADQPNAPGTCVAECAAAWPPFIYYRAASMAVIPGGDLGLGDHGDGTLQVTWQGMPLYRFARDVAPGDVQGNGVTAFGGAWSVVQPAPPPAPDDSQDSPAPDAPSDATE